MADSKKLAELIGPTLIVLGATEALNLKMFVAQIAPLVYLNGTILFVVGLALVRAHNRWTRSWPILITLIGWILLSAGLFRMIAPEAPQAGADIPTYAMLAVIVLVGLFLSYKGYGPAAEVGRQRN
jgi:uncharacterized membrane protein YhaH (DUF805 family)